MITFSEAQLLAWITPLLWPFLRALALFTAMPVLGTRTVPMRVRIGLAAFVSLAAQPMLPPIAVVPLDAPPALLVAAQQAAKDVGTAFPKRLYRGAGEVKSITYSDGARGEVVVVPALLTDPPAEVNFIEKGQNASFNAWRHDLNQPKAGQTTVHLEAIDYQSDFVPNDGRLGSPGKGGSYDHTDEYYPQSIVTSPGNQRHGSGRIGEDGADAALGRGFIGRQPAGIGALREVRGHELFVARREAGEAREGGAGLPGARDQPVGLRVLLCARLRGERGQPQVQVAIQRRVRKQVDAFGQPQRRLVAPRQRRLPPAAGDALQPAAPRPVLQRLRPGHAQRPVTAERPEQHGDRLLHPGQPHRGFGVPPAGRARDQPVPELTDLFFHLRRTPEARRGRRQRRIIRPRTVRMAAATTCAPRHSRQARAEAALHRRRTGFRTGSRASRAATRPRPAAPASAAARPGTVPAAGSPDRARHRPPVPAPAGRTGCRSTGSRGSGCRR